MKTLPFIDIIALYKVIPGLTRQELTTILLAERVASFSVTSKRRVEELNNYFKQYCVTRRRESKGMKLL